MEVISYKSAKNNLAKVMTGVCEDHTPVAIFRDDEQSVVLISKADYESVQETAYLLSSPANAHRLLEAITELGMKNES